MAKWFAVAFFLGGILVFPELFPLVGGNASARLHADVGQLTDEEYARMMQYFHATPSDPAIATQVSELITPPQPQVDLNAFFEFYEMYIEMMCSAAQSSAGQ
jgi:hypothetical protein